MHNNRYTNGHCTFNAIHYYLLYCTRIEFWRRLKKKTIYTVVFYSLEIRQSIACIFNTIPLTWIIKSGCCSTRSVNDPPVWYYCTLSAVERNLSKHTQTRNAHNKPLLCWRCVAFLTGRESVLPNLVGMCIRRLSSNYDATDLLYLAWWCIVHTYVILLIWLIQIRMHIYSTQPDHASKTQDHTRCSCSTCVRSFSVRRPCVHQREQERETESTRECV